MKFFYILFFSIFLFFSKETVAQIENEKINLSVLDPDVSGSFLNLTFESNSGGIYFSEDCGIFVSDSLVGNRFFIWDSFGNILQADAKGDYSFSVYSESLFKKNEKYFYKIENNCGIFTYLCD